MTKDTARGMIAEVRGLATVAGYRGGAQGDLEALADVIVRVSGLALIDAPLVLEAEMNPVVIKADGVVAVDGLIVLAEGAP